MMNRRIAPVPKPAHGPLMKFEGGAASSYDNMSGPDTSEPLFSEEKDQPMAKKESTGHGCGHGCGDMKTAHGLARHIKAKHGGFGGLGRALTAHGATGKTEEPQAGFMKNRVSAAHDNKISSYAGDGGGSYGKSRQG